MNTIILILSVAGFSLFTVGSVTLVHTYFGFYGDITLLGYFIIAAVRALMEVKEKP